MGRGVHCAGGPGGARNDGFPQGVEMGRELGLGKLGRVAIDSRRIRGRASRDRIDTEPRRRNERARRRRQIRTKAQGRGGRGRNWRRGWGSCRGA
jgi:hypothetical protein